MRWLPDDQLSSVNQYNRDLGREAHRPYPAAKICPSCKTPRSRASFREGPAETGRRYAWCRACRCACGDLGVVRYVDDAGKRALYCAKCGMGIEKGRKL